MGLTVARRSAGCRCGELWNVLPGGEDAAIIGRVEASDPHVVLETELGGQRILEELEDDPLPRIC